MSRIYLDHNATTPLNREVQEAIMPFLGTVYGNPSSVHAEGRAAREAVERARDQVASLLGVSPAEIVLVGSATEANNLAIRGLAESQDARGNHLVTSAVEHPSVLGAFEHLERRGFEVSSIGVNERGELDIDGLERTLRSDTALVSIMAANNETGVVFDLPRVAKIVKDNGALLHVDAVQAVGKLSLDVEKLGVDLLTLSGHKMGGPKGAAALYMRRGLRPEPILAGGHQERGVRGGTEVVWALIGLGEACALGARELGDYTQKVRALRDQLWEGIHGKIPRVCWNGEGATLLPNTLNLGFEDCPGDALLIQLDMEGVSASSGSACASGTVEASHVLLAMGQSEQRAREAIRFSLGRNTSRSDVENVLRILPGLVERTRSLVEEGDWENMEGKR